MNAPNDTRCPGGYLACDELREIDIEQATTEANARVRALEAALAKAAWALKHDKEWLDELGCDCGTDEPATCAWCENKRALADPLISAAAKEADE